MAAQATSETNNSFVTESRIYRRIAVALVALALLSVLSASINFGSVSANILIAMTIATVKATLVVLFFMGLREGRPVPAVIFFASLAFLGLFLSLTFVDATSRQHIPTPPLPHPTTPFVTR